MDQMKVRKTKEIGDEETFAIERRENEMERRMENVNNKREKHKIWTGNNKKTKQ